MVPLPWFLSSSFSYFCCALDSYNCFWEMRNSFLLGPAHAGWGLSKPHPQLRPLAFLVTVSMSKCSFVVDFSSVLCKSLFNLLVVFCYHACCCDKIQHRMRKGLIHLTILGPIAETQCQELKYVWVFERNKCVQVSLLACFFLSSTVYDPLPREWCCPQGAGSSHIS